MNEILQEAQRFKNCKSEAIYKRFKNQLLMQDLEPKEYEDVIFQIARILGV